MSTLAIVYIVYAIILLAGGVLGFVRARSRASLLGSGVFAVVALVAAGLLLDHQRSGQWIGVIAVLAVAIFFLRRYLTTRKPMPAIPIIVISVIVLVLALSPLARP